jgi:diacylglycerol kinase (ATP)
MAELRPANPPTRGRLIRSFGYAIRGIVMLVAWQANARIHALATVTVLALGFFFHIERWEWCAVVGVIGLVWAAEGLNTAIEALTDLVSPGAHPLAGRAKDIAAGAVLCAAISAVVIGLIVFAPRIILLLPAR